MRPTTLTTNPIVLRGAGKIDMNYCISCGVELGVLDEDLNGDKNATCAKCRAEENHDFDAEPDARYDRAGHRIERRAGNNLPKNP